MSAHLLAPLPARGHVVIRNAYVMTMVPGEVDLPDGDVHVTNGAITAVGGRLSAPGAEAIDGRGFIVMPGLIDTHWHMWTTLMRNMAGSTPPHGYFPTTTAIGNVYTPSDMYYGTLLSAAEALFSGITTVHDWCHNIITAHYAEGDLRALRDAGIRARFSYGPARCMPATRAIDVGALARLHRDWPSLSNDGLLTLGLGWRGVQAPFLLSDGRREIRPLPEAVYRKEHDAACSLGLPISVHVNATRHDRGHVLALQKQGLLIKDLQVVHGLSSTPEEMDAMAAAGAVVSVSPYSELRIGFGMPKILEYIDHGVTAGLSVDSTPLTGSGDMFGIMKAVHAIENGRAEDEYRMSARRVIALATADGARSLGLDKRIGTIAPGKRADLIMLDTRDINIGPFTDAPHMVVASAQPWNVHTVMVDGRILKRGGKLVAINVPALMAEATAASHAVRQRAGWW